jgi:hypothetical protein
LLRQVKLRILSSTRGRWALGSALCVLVALVAAWGNERGIRLLPPSLKAQNVEIAGASTQALVELPTSSVLQSGADAGTLDVLTTRAVLLGELMSTPPVLSQIASHAGIDPAQLSASTSYIAGMLEEQVWPDFEVRANQIVEARAPYQLNIQPDPVLPRIQIYARAPNLGAAERLADSAVPGLQDFLRSDAISHGVNPADLIRLEQVSPALGGVLTPHAKVYIVGMTFLIVLALSAGMLAGAVRVRRGWKLAAKRRRETATRHHDHQPPGHANGTGLSDLSHSSREPRLASATPSGGTVDLPSWHGLRIVNRAERRAVGGQEPVLRTTYFREAAAPRGPRRPAADGLDDWPHTTRVLPWMIAFFLFLVWLIPFDAFQIGRSLPIDLKLDRVVLPLIVAPWALALVVGGRHGPRLRLTWVHASVFIFAGFACLSLVVNLHYLNDVLELDQAVKRFAVLVAYVSLFVLTASVVRRSEVQAFLRYTLALAVVAAIGTIIEYRTGYNVFYDVTHRLLPAFQVGQTGGLGVDDIGRRLVEGPADTALEAVGMFTLALPIALVGLAAATQRRERILYGLAAGLLLAGAISTERKSGLLGPLAVILTVAYFKRKELVRFAPLLVVAVGAAKVLSPGAIGSTVIQLDPTQLGVNTVTDRVMRYDAIRPDVWLHLAFGQGFGTYTVRVLDNELLGRLVEGGVLGLAAYLLMILSVVAVTAGLIRRREPVTSTVGLIAASGAMGVLMLSATYDLMGFPHVPYILFSLFGLLAAAVTSANPAKRPRLSALPRAHRSPAAEAAWSS